ncbi:MAG: hypothetical protein K8R88_12190 [Armatimonadetes bacterium]|nr:hypothetical protein [Armatimonadota bacterium]
MILLPFSILASGVVEASSSKIVSAALFKNGYAMVVRELPVTKNATVIQDIPQASLGTFWVSSTGDVKIDSLLATSVPTSIARKASSFAELLTLNVGKAVTITTVNLGTLAGSIESMDGETVTLKRERDTIMFGRSEIRLISFEPGAKTSTNVNSLTRQLQISTTGKGTILVYGLERGMTWTPGYAVDLVNNKELTLTAKATVLNDLGDLAGANVELVTGFPNVPWMTVTEPILSGQSVDQFTGFLDQIGMNRAPGGFGGGGARGGMMTQNAAPAMEADFNAAWTPTAGSGQQSEDLFFYSVPNYTLKKGDRKMSVLFQAKADFEHIYTLDMGEEYTSEDYQRPANQPKTPLEVWHMIEFANSAKQPLTTGPITVYKDNKLIGQDTLSYTSASAPCRVKINKSLDVSADSTEIEKARVRDSLRTNFGIVYDLVTVEGTVKITNRKSETIKMKVNKAFEGESTTALGADKVTKTAKRLRDVNPHTLINWKPTIKSGDSWTATYTYTMYVRTN